MTDSGAGVLTTTFWRGYLVTMRPYLLFVSGAAGAVGLAFIPEPVAWRVLLAFLPLFFSYGLGQALTDCFQTDTDSISSPYRPMVRGEISRSAVMAISLVGLTIGVFIMGFLNRWALILAALTVIGLLTYTPLKRTWWGGPPWNSWIVALLPLIGRLADPGIGLFSLFGRSRLETGAFVAAVLAIFFGYANFVVMGYFKDISADRQTGYNTFPVRFGWLANAVYSDLVALGAAAGSALAIWLSGRVNWLAAAVFCTGVIVNLWAQVAIHGIRDEVRSHGPIANVVRAFVLYCLAMVLTMKPGWVLPAALFYVAFELVLGLRPERAQV